MFNLDFGTKSSYCLIHLLLYLRKHLYISGMSVNSNYGNTLRNDDSFSVIEGSLPYNVQSAFSDDDSFSPI